MAGAPPGRGCARPRRRAIASRITMFGDEPHGNYNRILLSSVLAGTQQPRRHLHQPAGVVRRATASRCTPASGRRAIDRERAGRVRRRRRRRALRRARLRHRQPCRSCRRSDGLRPATTARFKDGVFVFRTLDDCDAHAGAAQRAGRAAVVIGGGLLGLEAARGLLEPRPRRQRRAPDGAPHGRAARSRRRR